MFIVKADTVEGTGTSVLACNQTYYAVEFEIIGDDIYFVNYKTGGLFGDSHLYKVAKTGGDPEQVM